MDILDKWRNLNTAERAFISEHPLTTIDFNANANTALAEAQKRFAVASLRNGSGDAFRHCFWSAMNARDHGGKLAKQFGDAHEAAPGNPADEKKMDLFNNGIGFALGRNAAGASNEHLAVLCVEAWAGGKLIQMNMAGTGDLIYSNSYETKLYSGAAEANK